MKKKDLINHLKNLLNIEEKEFEIEQYSYFSPEITMWRKRFLKENNIHDKTIIYNFSSIISENLMKSSPEEMLELYINKNIEDYE